MKKLLTPALAIFVASCAQNIPSQNRAVVAMSCDVIRGRANDWDVISDDLARNIYRHNLMCQELDKK